jgi:hypothetical protein
MTFEVGVLRAATKPFPSLGDATPAVPPVVKVLQVAAAI